MRRGRRIDHSWEIRKYKYDMALYAHCRCGFQYACSHNKRTENGFILEQEISSLYNYCPNCGAHKKWYNEEPRKMDIEVWQVNQ